MALNRKRDLGAGYDGLRFRWARSYVHAGLMACALLCLSAVCSQALAAEGLDARTRPLWERHWRVYAQRCAEFEGGFLCCPKFDRRYPSSTGMTLRQAEAKLSERIKVGGGAQFGQGIAVALKCIKCCS